LARFAGIAVGVGLISTAGVGVEVAAALCGAEDALIPPAAFETPVSSVQLRSMTIAMARWRENFIRSSFDSG
jgi:hypothetical protein